MLQYKDNKIYQIEEAYKKTINYLIKQGIQFDQIIKINQGRYLIVKTKDNNNFLIMYKRSVFRNFGFEFRLHGETGVGESLNIEDYTIAMNRGVKTVLVIYRTGILYSIPLEDFANKGHSWKNKEGKGVLSVSIHKLKREVNLFEE